MSLRLTTGEEGEVEQTGTFESMKEAEDYIVAYDLWPGDTDLVLIDEETEQSWIYLGKWEER